MKHFVVIFNKPVILPGDKLKKIKTYGVVFEKTEIATFDRMSNYIRNYILAVVEIFKDGVEQFDEWGYKKNGKVFVRSGAGIVADSVPEKEHQECINKAAAVVKALERSGEMK